jgi:hypothetical protein
MCSRRSGGGGKFVASGRVPRFPTPGKHGAPKIENLHFFRELFGELQALVFNICSAFLREASVSLAPLNIRAISSFL